LLEIVIGGDICLRANNFVQNFLANKRIFFQMFAIFAKINILT